MELTSGLAKAIASMLEYREAMGFSKDTYEYMMKRFDSYCSAHHPGESMLTEDVVRGWLASEVARGCSNSVRHRASEMRTLAKYIRAFGGEAFVLPPRTTPIRTGFIPYILNDAELESLFRSIDRKSASVFLDMAVRGAFSVLFRLVYTCGLRPQEGRTARVADLNLSRGELFLRDTKGHSERIVGLSTQMIELLTKYMRRLAAAAPGSEFLFPTGKGKPRSKYDLSAFFRDCWREADVNADRVDVPRVRIYDLRHRFASTVLQKWLDDGRDPYSALPILRAYMGHARIRSTLYYVHLLPENLRRSPKVDWERLNAIIPEV